LVIAETTKLADPDIETKDLFIAKYNLEKQLNISLNRYNWLEELWITDPRTQEPIYYYSERIPQEIDFSEKHFQDALDKKVGMSEMHISVKPISNELGIYEEGVPTLLISVPIAGEVGIEGVLTARINIFAIEPGVKSHISDLASADTYIVNSDGYFLSSSAFPQSIQHLIQKRAELELRVIEPDSEEFTTIFQMAKNNDSATNLEGYPNYLGQTVVGSIIPIEETNWFYIVEIFRNEAYQHVFSVQNILIPSTVITITLIIMMSLIFANNFLRPIKKLTETIEDIRAGNRESKIDPMLKKSRDEIAKLASAFDEMRVNILENEKNLGNIVKERTIELEEANIELRSIDKKKEEFASMITHELKTPLTPIIGWCQTLKKPKIMGELTDKQIKAINNIQENAKRLQGLIGDVLDVQKLDLNRMQFDYIDLNVVEFMGFLHQNLQNAMESKKIQFINSTTEKNLHIKSDKNRLEQVLNNFIFNAIDFVPEENGRIEIKAQEQDESILFYVKDNGVGIPKEKLSNLFKKFYQVESGLTRKHGGSGLGLTISQGIVDGLGGKIGVESEVGKGSLFYCTIPKQQGEKPE
jgi:signal transduction histidine kinase